MPWQMNIMWWAVGVCAALAIVLLTRWYWQRRAAQLLASPALELSSPNEGLLVAFVANASKPEVSAARGELRAACLQRGLAEPLWIETTADDHGGGQTETALSRGADVVVAVGGDGTVRAVTERLAGTSVPMGIIPMGTGNLLARNLQIPLTGLDPALSVAVGGLSRKIDVGWVTVDEPATEAESEQQQATPAQLDSTHVFLVLSGLGFDADMVATTDADLKSRMGWIAYFWGGLRHMHGNRIHAEVTVDDQAPQAMSARSLMVANCGQLPARITLIPDAAIDDGWLDWAVIDTKLGLVGWMQLFGTVVSQGFGLRRELPLKIGWINHHRARNVAITLSKPTQVQVDGDLIGLVRRVTFRVDPGVLVVRTPHGVNS